MIFVCLLFNVLYGMCGVCVCLNVYMCVCPLCARIWVCGVYICVYCVCVYLRSCGRAGRGGMEGFAADFLRDFAGGVVSCLLGGRLGACRRIQAFQGFSCDFLNSQVFSRHVRQFAYSLSNDKI